MGDTDAALRDAEESLAEDPEYIKVNKILCAFSGFVFLKSITNLLMQALPRFLRAVWCYGGVSNVKGCTGVD